MVKSFDTSLKTVAFFLSLVAIRVFAADCKVVSESGDICYSGIFPKLFKDEVDGSIGFYSYTLKGKFEEGWCSHSGKDLLFSFNDIAIEKEDSHRDKKTEYCFSGKFVSDPIFKTRKKSDSLDWITSRVLFHEVMYPKLATIPPPDPPTKRYNLMSPSLNQEAQLHSETQSVVKLIDKSFTENAGDKIIKQYKVDGEPENPISESLFYHLGRPPFLSSNRCWLVIPSSKFGEKRGDLIRQKEQELHVYSLNEGGDGKLCSELGYRRWDRQDKFKKNTYLDLLKKDDQQIENAIEVGADYAAFSPLKTPDELHVVYQTGFPSNGDSEKEYTGNLQYVVIKRKSGGGVYRFVDSNPIVNITGACKKGWEHSPQFSRDKSRLFFMVMNRPGDDKSKSHLYVVNVKDIQPGFLCNEAGDEINVVNLTNEFEKFRGLEFDYPIRGYSLSSDMKKLSLIFEEQGESVVRFFKYNKHNNRIVYEYPETISGVGNIYDIVRSEFFSSQEGGEAYYLMHSYLNSPISISRCYFSGVKFICGNRNSPTHAAYRGKTPLQNLDKIPSGVSVTRETVQSQVDPDRQIDVFALKPSKPNGKAIISVHGGPNEAWDGRFSPRDHRLAEIGYTVYLPNPAGSSGYGFETTDAGDNSWGTTIFFDIEDVINYLDRKKTTGVFDSIYLMGFSFGGYIANWIQTEPRGVARSKLSALIAVSALFDLREFASSSDQLWFPKYHLKCSDPLNPAYRTKQCLNISCDEPANHRDYPVLIGQNPACYTMNLTKNSIPTLVISGREDQRIPFSYNVPSMLKAYRKGCAPHTVQVEKFSVHDFPSHRSAEQGDLIHTWLGNVASCRSKHAGTDEYLKCKYKSINAAPNPFAKDRSINFVFDNPVCYIRGSELRGVNEKTCPDTSDGQPYLYPGCVGSP